MRSSLTQSQPSSSCIARLTSELKLLPDESIGFYYWNNLAILINHKMTVVEQVIGWHFSNAIILLGLLFTIQTSVYERNSLLLCLSPSSSSSLSAFLQNSWTYLHLKVHSTPEDLTNHSSSTTKINNIKVSRQDSRTKLHYGLLNQPRRSYGELCQAGKLLGMLHSEYLLSRQACIWEQISWLVP